jgi:hypothetical protein
LGDTAVGFETRLNEWLSAEAGVEQRRRIVRRNDERILLSKFAPGFADRLRRSMGLVPELFDIKLVWATYTHLAEIDPSARRVDTWHRSMRQLLGSFGAERGLTGDLQAEVLAGIDSVAVVMDMALWSAPLCADEYSPLPGEVGAFRDAVAPLDPGHDLFSRYYGSFAGAEVVNHCPGAPFARALLAQAWEVCTGTTAPAER